MSFHATTPQADAAADTRISHAFVKKPGANLAACSAPGIGIPDAERAAYQHDAYCRALAQCGVELRALKYDPAHPDGCSISDTAVLAGNLAVICNFDAKSPRQGEQQAAASLLAGSRILKFITAPGTLDAADVARIGNDFYIGLSDRTNTEGAAQLAFFLLEFGYRAHILDIAQETPLRLSAAVCDLGMGADGHHRILLREDLARNYAFIAYEKIVVPFAARGAANAVMVNGTLLMPQGYAGVADMVRALGVSVIELQMSEFDKMNSGMASLSLRLPARAEDAVVVRLTDAKARRVA